MQSIFKGIVAVILNYSFIGFSFLFTKISVGKAPVFIVLSFRFLISFLILSIYLILVRKTKKYHFIDTIKKDWKLIGIFVLLQPILFFMFQAFALVRIDSSEAGLISSISPSLIAVLGFFILHEKLNHKKILSLICSFGGLIFIYIMKGAVNQKIDLLGIIFIIIAISLGALYQVIARRLSKEYDPLTLTFIPILLGAIIFPLFGLIFGEWQQFCICNITESNQFFIGIIYLALFTTVGTSILTIIGLKHLKVAEQGIFAGLATLISIFAGVVILSEKFYWYQIIGAIFVIGGIILMNLSKMEDEPIVIKIGQ